MLKRCVGGILGRVPREGHLPKTPMIRSPRTFRSLPVLLIVHFCFETGTSSIQGYVRPIAPHMQMWSHHWHPKRGTHSQPPFPEIERLQIFSVRSIFRTGTHFLVQ